MYRGPMNRHDHCCTLGSVANQVNEVTYKTKHAKESCNCEMVSFEQGETTKAAAWIRVGHTGVIVRNVQANTGPGAWKLVESHYAGSVPRRYVAISHVWA